MKWFDGSELDVKQFTGESLCEKLSLEMWDSDSEQRAEFPDFIQSAMCIIDFDTITSMEGFSTPFFGEDTPEYYAQIIAAFRVIGDAQDADILAEALRLDAQYQEMSDSAADDAESDRLSDELSEKLSELEPGLYLNTDADMWAMLYRWLDENLQKL